MFHLKSKKLIILLSLCTLLTHAEFSIPQPLLSLDSHLNNQKQKLNSPNQKSLSCTMHRKKLYKALQENPNKLDEIIALNIFKKAIKTLYDGIAIFECIDVIEYPFIYCLKQINDSIELCKSISQNIKNRINHIKLDKTNNIQIIKTITKNKTVFEYDDTPDYLAQCERKINDSIDICMRMSQKIEKSLYNMIVDTINLEYLTTLENFNKKMEDFVDHLIVLKNKVEELYEYTIKS